MSSREDVAKAIAFFEGTDDIALLHEMVAEVAPRAKKMVGQLLSRGTEESIPPPAELRAAREAATREQAIRTLRQVNDFSLLQVLAQTIGRRIEAIEIVASAEFPDGARVSVPAKASFPAKPPFVAGTVEETGTNLRVLLDNGETWSGPPSLAKLASESQ